MPVGLFASTIFSFLRGTGGLSVPFELGKGPEAQAAGREVGVVERWFKAPATLEVGETLYPLTPALGA